MVFRLAKTGGDYHLIYRFQGALANDGGCPNGLVEGSDGYLYGTTRGNTVFKLAKSGGEFQVLHHFQAAPGEGADPAAGVVEGRDGALYGTTARGGKHGFGTVFKLRRDGSGYQVLHHFEGEAAGSPREKILATGDGSLYGVAEMGGVGGCEGAIWQLLEDGSGFGVLHAFGGEVMPGGQPATALVAGRNGEFYGATSDGGIYGNGVIFRIYRDGKGYQALHHFDPDGARKPPAGAGIREGFNPKLLVAGDGGWLFGLNSLGGNRGAGTVFQWSPAGDDFRVLHHFAADPDDGRRPGALMAAAGERTLLGLTPCVWRFTEQSPKSWAAKEKPPLEGPGATCFQVALPATP